MLEAASFGLYLTTPSHAIECNHLSLLRSSEFGQTLQHKSYINFVEIQYVFVFSTFTGD